MGRIFEADTVKFYFSPLFLAGVVFLVAGLWVFIWLPVAGMGCLALLTDWIIRGSNELTRKQKWMLLVSATLVFVMFFYVVIGFRSQPFDNQNF